MEFFLTIYPPKPVDATLRRTVESHFNQPKADGIIVETKWDPVL